jgi:hypothetical protein
MRRIRSHLTYANVIATLAMFVALGGSTYAVATIGADDIKRNAVRSKHIKKRAVTSRKIDSGAIRAKALGPISTRSSGATLQPGASLPSASVSCRPGEQAIGGGSRGGAPDLSVITSALDLEDNGWAAVYRNDGTTSASFSAEVICLRR